MSTSDAAAANRAFYEAFARGDLAAMDDLWARRHPVACIHPGWPALLERRSVMASWADILAAGPPPIRAEDARVRLYGPLALVICRERVGAHELAATNAFVREDGAWRMVLHQAGPAARIAAGPAPRVRRLH